MKPPLSLWLLVSGLALAACAGNPATPAAAAQPPSAAAPVATTLPVPAIPPATNIPVVTANPSVAVPAPAATPASPIVAVAKIDFAQQVKPFFQYYCYQCHGDGRQRAGVSLEAKAIAMRFITPGNPARSDVYSALIRYPGASDHMPPATEEQPAADEIAMIKQWIVEGANWPDP